MRNILIIALLAMAFTGCRSTKPVIEYRDNVVTVTEREWDSVFFTEPDSASIMALIECDSSNNAYISRILSLQAGIATRPAIKIVDRVLTAECKVDSMAVYVRMKSKIKTTDQVKTIIKTEFIEKPDSWWTKTLKICGYIFLFSLMTTALWIFLQLRR